MSVAGPSALPLVLVLFVGLVGVASVRLPSYAGRRTASPASTPGAMS